MTFIFFFFNDTATTEIYTLSLHDALPISCAVVNRASRVCHQTVDSEVIFKIVNARLFWTMVMNPWNRSEEHTSELQSQSNLVCRLLLEKKKKIRNHIGSHSDVQRCRSYTS